MGFTLGSREYTRLRKDFVLPIIMENKDAKVFLQSIDTLLSMDFISGISELKQLLIKLKILGASSQYDTKPVSLDLNYTRLSAADGSFEDPLKYFERFLEAIRMKKILYIKYKDFQDQFHSWFFQPMHIRESGDRWYLIGYDMDHPDLKSAPPVFALGFERILEARETSERSWIERLTFDAEEYFSDIVGVGRPWNRKAERISIKVSKEALNYWKTKRIHHSQDIGETDQYGFTEIYFQLIPNKEFFEFLFGQSKDIQILEPNDLHARYLRGRS